MPKFRTSQESESETAIDISPLIDCVFILLIFFIVTTTFIEEWGGAVDKPSPGQASAADDDKPSLVIELLASGEVRFNGLKTEIGVLEQQIKTELGGRDDIPAIIKADRDVPAGRTSLAVDQARLGGAVAVLLANR